MIRPIVREDIPFIVRSLQHMRTESIVGQACKDDPEYVTENLETMFDGPGFFGYVYGNQHGYMFGTVAATWFSDTLRSYEQSLYVKPEFRGSPAAVRLIRAFIAESTERGAIEIHAGGFTGIKTDSLFKLYERLGFERHGIGVILRIPH